MRTHGLNHLSDTELLRDLRALLAREREITAAVLAHLAEVDARRLYAPTGYPSMFEYCVRELGLSEDAALKRIQAARAARRFPAIFEAVAAGRLHLSGVVLLAPHLTAGNVEGLLAAAAGKTKAEIEMLLAERFPRTELLAMVGEVPSSAAPEFRQPAPGHVGGGGRTGEPAPGQVGHGGCAGEHAPGHVHGSGPDFRLKPLSAESFAIQFTIDRGTHDKLRHVQALLSHRLPSGDIAQLFDQALDALTEKLEKRKCAATRSPRPRPRRSDANPRHIPAHVKRAVWERDQGRCTFVGPTGHRCASRKFLEFDHVEPVARGGQSTVAGIRLRCRTHNQFEAERTLGAAFMGRKRDEARRRAVEAPMRGAAQAPTAATRSAVAVRASEIKACLRELGFRSEEIRRALVLCETMPEATLEEQVRAALKSLCPKARIHRPTEPSPMACT